MKGLGLARPDGRVWECLSSLGGWLVLALTLLGAGGARAQPYDEEHVLILLDRSGSMQSTRQGGATRFDEALLRSRRYLTASSDPTREVSIWTFEGYSSVEESGFTPAAGALSTLARLQVGSGVTPLAQALCAAVDRLLEHKPGVNALKRLWLISDGEENSTPVTSPCYGPSSVGVYPDLTWDSWQWKVRNMLKTGDPLREDSSDYALVFDVDVFEGYVNFGLTASMLPSSFMSFLQGASQASGGRFTRIADNRPLPVLGDVNQDGCVNRLDYQYVLTYFGLRVPPAPAAADVDLDGVVGYSDYMLVVGAQGHGCGPVPFAREVPPMRVEESLGR
ncbi:VWA domain-containing protein [Myxococcus sp. K38C18041901]|uniref:VWA domain-containing protein n=1 Tax=Myxococcus guangdongensis TaxID=2906760 RepID=UPI0020A75839|nr:VWA domain-containing protein [Myxococcus guangdongensis]MCP3062902.1 VWA domain-containing protein [Myxococcus guangdongensis]